MLGGGDHGVARRGPPWRSGDSGGDKATDPSGMTLPMLRWVGCDAMVCGSRRLMLNSQVGLHRTRTCCPRRAVGSACSSAPVFRRERPRSGQDGQEEVSVDWPAAVAVACRKCHGRGLQWYRVCGFLGSCRFLLPSGWISGGVSAQNRRLQDLPSVRQMPHSSFSHGGLRLELPTPAYGILGDGRRRVADFTGWWEREDTGT